MSNRSTIIAFDIDGTLLNDNRQISNENLEALKLFDNRNTIRIAATGRNFYSVKRVLPPDFPIEYLVFSSGAGIMDWKTKEILYSRLLDESQIKIITDTILPYKLNFTLHLAIPNNHHILLYDRHSEPDDLIAYTSFYKKFAQPLNPKKLPKKATQVIVLLNSHVHLFNQFTQKLKPLKTVLTTSPINHKSMWMEIFNPEVSKSNGISWIIKHKNITAPFIVAIGNDYNDLDLLNFADKSFVVSNAPDELQKKFTVTKSNNENGLAEAIKIILHS